MAELNIKTPIGEVTVDRATDPDFPGVYISIDGVSLVLVEYDSVSTKHMIRVWNQNDPDNDPEYTQVIEEKTEPNITEE